MSAYTVESESAIDAVADGDLIRVYDTSGGDYNSVSVAQLRAGVAGGIVDTTATSLSITAASHAGKTVTISSTAPIAITMPAATGTGNKYRFWVAVACTGTASTIAALTTDIVSGYAWAVTTSTDNAEGFKTSATSDKVSMNGTTLGGVVGDVYEFIDVKSGVWSVQGYTAPTGTEATPFSAT